MRKIVKPLIIIKVPNRWPIEALQDMRISLKGSAVSQDYFILLIADDIDQVDVKVFYDKDIEEKKLEDIQTELLNLIKEKQ
jgi:hypothetical protein